MCILFLKTVNAIYNYFIIDEVNAEALDALVTGPRCVKSNAVFAQPVNMSYFSCPAQTALVLRVNDTAILQLSYSTCITKEMH